MANSRRAAFVWPLLFFVILLVPLTVAIEAAVHFSGSAIDGPFQLYNALRRTAVGFRPGVDFQYFHGFGVAYLHYPFFRLFGATFRASQLAREMLSPIVYPIVLIVFFRAFVSDWRRVFCLSMIALALTLALRMTAIVFALNGMVGLRSALPTLLPAIVVVVADRRFRTALVGLALGLGIFISTEQGLAAILAYVLVSIVATWRRADRRGQLLEAAGSLAIAVLTLLVCLLVIGGPAGAAGILHYNFGVIPMDQYWYFGSPPNRFISSWADGIRMSIGMWQVGVGILLGAICLVVAVRRFWRAPEGDLGRRRFALLLLAAYALVSTAALLGVFVAVYVQTCWRAVFLFALVELDEWSTRRDIEGARVPRLGVPREMAFAGFAAPVAMLVLVPTTIGTLFISLPHALGAHVVGKQRWTATGIWPQTLADGQQILDSRRGPDGKLPTLWSTYAGWLEARNGIFHPSTDYVIHALGPDGRAKYVRDFTTMQPQLVQTVLPTYTQYEAWIEKTSWDFYRELLQRYAVVGVTPWSIFWARLPVSQPGPALIGRRDVAPGSTSITLPPVPAAPDAPITLLEVELTYDVHNPWRWMPMVGASPRYLVGIQGAVTREPATLNPYVHTMRFPILATPGSTPTLTPGTFSLLPGPSFEIRSVQVSVVPVSPANIPWLVSLSIQQGLRQP